MRSGHVCSVGALYYATDALNLLLTASGLRWFERTLDDSASRRITRSRRAFLATDAITQTYQRLRRKHRISGGASAYARLPFMATKHHDGRCAPPARPAGLREAPARRSLAAARRIKEEEGDLIQTGFGIQSFRLKRRGCRGCTGAFAFYRPSAQQVEYLSSVMPYR